VGGGTLQLTHQHKAAILYLVGGKNKSETAELVGVNRSTLVRWLRDKNFKEQYELLNSQLVACITGELQALLTRVPTVLKEAMESKHVGHRLKACEILLKFGIKTAGGKKKDE
jgi:transposase-like protein